MASQFKNSNLGYYLYSGLVITIGLASLVVFYFMVTGFNIGKYSENTLVGSVYIGGLTEAEAEELIRTRINGWLEDDSVIFEVGYQGYYYEFDRELFTFDISASMRSIRDGGSNPLKVEYSTTAMNTVIFEVNQQAFMQGLQDQFTIDDLLADIVQDASMMKTFARKQLNHYIINDDNINEIIYETTLPMHPDVNVGSILGKMGNVNQDFQFEVKSHTLFSVDEVFTGSFTSSELSMIGSILLDVVTHSNFNILERHSNPVIDINYYTMSNYPYFGRNIRINRNVSYDFSFENPSFIDYTLEFYQASPTHLGVRLIGVPYINTIKVTTETTDIPFDTETTTNPNFVQNGQLGRIVIVNRVITNLDEEVVSNRNIIFEFYPPITEVNLDN